MCELQAIAISALTTTVLLIVGAAMLATTIASAIERSIADGLDLLTPAAPPGTAESPVLPPQAAPEPPGAVFARQVDLEQPRGQVGQDAVQARPGCAPCDAARRAVARFFA